MTQALRLMFMHKSARLCPFVVLVLSRILFCGRSGAPVLQFVNNPTGNWQVIPSCVVAPLVFGREKTPTGFCLVGVLSRWV